MTDLEAKDAAAQQECAAMHATIGSLISRWGMVEAALVSLLSRVVGPTHGLPGGAIVTPPGNPGPHLFYAIEGMRARLSIIETLLPFRLGDEEFETIESEWKGVKRHLEYPGKWRNRLAHWNVMAYPNEPHGRRAQLVPAFASPGGMKAKPESYTARDLEEIAPLFLKIYGEISRFGQTVGEMPAVREHHIHSFAHLVGSYVYNRGNDLLATTREALLAQFARPNEVELPNWLKRDPE